MDLFRAQVQIGRHEQALPDEFRQRREPAAALNAFEPFPVSAIELISGKRRVQGWASGTAADSTETMAFARLQGIKTWTETFPLADAARANQRMLAGEVRFRAVLTP